MHTGKHIETLTTHVRDCKRELLYAELEPCAPEEFLTRYAESQKLLENECNMDTQEMKTNGEEVYYLKSDLRKGKAGDQVIKCARHGRVVKVLISGEYVYMPIRVFNEFCSKNPVPHDNPMVGRPYSWFVSAKR